MLAEWARRWGAPLAALTSSCLVLCCLVTIDDLALDWPRLRGLVPELAGWAALAVVVSVAVAGAALLSTRWSGPGTALATGAVAAVLGVASSRDITSGAQLELALLSLAVAAGACFAAGLGLALDSPAPRSSPVLLAWLLPLGAGWAPLGWLTLHARPERHLTVGLHPSVWLVVAAAVVLVVVGLLCQLAPQPPQHSSADGADAADTADAANAADPDSAFGTADRTVAMRPSAGWEAGWAALGTLVVAGGSIAMLVGFADGAEISWLRPVVLLATALMIAGLACCGWLLPDDAARAAYCAVTAALLAGPSCVTLVTLAGRTSGPLPSWVMAALTAAALLGSLVGWRFAPGAVVGGPLLLALGAATAWVMPTSAGSMVVACLPLTVGVAVSVTAALRLAAGSAAALGYVGFAGYVALLTGLFIAFPLASVLGTQPTAAVADIRAGGRVLLGLAFALAVSAAAGAAVFQLRARQSGAPVRRPAAPRPPPPYESTRDQRAPSPSPATPRSPSPSNSPDKDTGAGSG